MFLWSMAKQRFALIEGECGVIVSILRGATVEQHVDSNKCVQIC